MNMQMLVHIGLFYIIEILKLFILPVLELNMFLKKLIGHKNIKTNIFRVQASDSIMCGYFCIGFFDFMLAGKTLIDYISLFCLYHFDKNDDAIYNYFKNELMQFC